MAFKNEESYYIELTKYAKLAIWMKMQFEEGTKVTDLIGLYPSYGTESYIEKSHEVEENSNEAENQWTEWAKKNGYSVKKTGTGIKIVR